MTVPFPHVRVPGPNGLVAYAARPGGGPRVQIYRHGILTADFFAHEDTQRGGVNVAWHWPTEELYTGAGVGGAPVLKVYNPGGWETQPARWIGNPEDRNGSNPIPVEVYHPPLTAGAGYTVLLHAEGRPTAAYVTALFNELARLLVPAGCRVTTERPDAYPWTYGQAFANVPLGFSPGDPSGEFPGPRWDSPPTGSSYEVRAVYARTSDNPVRLAATCAHEVGHAFGVPHRDETPNLMHRAGPAANPNWHTDDLATVQARTAAADRRTSDVGPRSGVTDYRPARGG